MIIEIIFFLIRKTIGLVIDWIWVREVKGIENIPLSGPAIIAFNHESYFDFLCFTSISPRNIHYLSAEKFFTHKLWRILMTFTGQIQVKRQTKDKREVHNLVFDHLSSGKIIGIFPEGTRAPTKEEMLKAFSGVAKYAFKGGVPVIPVGLKGTYDVMSRHDKKPKFIKVVNINIGEPIKLDKFRDIKLNTRAYELLTGKIMLKIAELSGKPYRHYNGPFDI